MVKNLSVNKITGQIGYRKKQLALAFQGLAHLLQGRRQEHSHQGNGSCLPTSHLFMLPKIRITPLVED
jgi:hypothetical protein